MEMGFPGPREEEEDPMEGLFSQEERGGERYVAWLDPVVASATRRIPT